MGGRGPTGVKVKAGAERSECYYLSNWKNVTKARGAPWPEMPVMILLLRLTLAFAVSSVRHRPRSGCDAGGAATGR